MYFGKGKGKVNADVVSADIYRFYKDLYKDKALSKYKFWKIWEDFIEIRMQLLIYNNLDFHMGRRLGTIGVRVVHDVITINKDGKVKVRMNYGESVKLWKETWPDKTPEEIKAIKNKPIIYYTNSDVDGKVANFCWDKSTCTFKNHSHYRFLPTRKWYRKLAENIKQTKRLDYYGKYS